MGVLSYLADPHLVRRIQEAFGVRELSPKPKDGTSASDSDSECDGSSRRGRASSARSTNGGPRGGPMEWLNSKAKIKRRVRKYVSPEPPPSSLALRLEEVEYECNAFVDLYFRVAKEAGYETFFVVFLPFVFWNFDTYLARHVTMLWTVSLYIVQAAKQVFRLRRPDSPPVVRLELNMELEKEFGFPSSHATAAAMMPLSCLYCSYSRYVLPFPFALLAVVLVVWFLSVSISRVYLGVHSVLDVVGGTIISLMVFAFAPLMKSFDDNVIFGSDHITIKLLVLVVILLYIYPVKRNTWSCDRGDCAALLGAVCGMALGIELTGRSPDDTLPEPIVVGLPTMTKVWLGLVRMVLGSIFLLTIRFVMKLLCFRLLPAIMPSHGVEDVRRRPLVELPYKIITYGTLGYFVICVAPVMFEICGISRW